MHLTKNFSSEKKYDQNTTSNHRTERKNVQNSLSYGRKTSFLAILKTCENNFYILNFEALIFKQYVVKNKNT
jgi:hypothetical protein